VAYAILGAAVAIAAHHRRARAAPAVPDPA
jgi:hypothetical protein